MWTATEKIQRFNDCAWQSIDEKTLILKPERSMAHELNSSGTWVWNKIETPQSFSVLLEDFCCEFDISQQVASSDLEQLLTNMKNQGLIECL